MPASDVTALVLTLDEPYARRALASVERQRPAVADVVVVRGQTPFHRALNAGAARVGTPYFIQVDADMVLDPTCCADLRAAVADTVGVAVGHLRDPLVGRIAGVKLFRTACFADERFPDSISPDTDFGHAIARRGWATVYAVKYPSDPADPLHALGDHQPDYSPLYTFRKFALQGARHRYRRAAAGLERLAQRLHASAHQAALVALVGTAYGISLPAGRDLLTPFAADADFERLMRFLARPAGRPEVPPDLRSLEHLAAREAWHRGYACGVDLHRRRAGASFATALRHLGDRLGDARGPIAWAAMAGLCHGLFADAVDPAAVDDAFALFNQVLPAPYRERA